MVLGNNVMQVIYRLWNGAISITSGSAKS